MACVELARPSAMRLLLKVMRCDVPSRHSSGVVAVEARPGGRQVLVGGPGQRAVVDDHVVRAALRGDRVEVAAAPSRGAGLAGPHADVPHDHVVRGDVDAAADQRDAGRRRGLAGDGEERLVDLQRRARPGRSRRRLRTRRCAGPWSRAPREASPGRSAASVVTRRICAAAAARRVRGPALRAGKGERSPAVGARAAGAATSGAVQRRRQHRSRSTRAGDGREHVRHGAPPRVIVPSRAAAQIVNDTGFLYTCRNACRRHEQRDRARGSRRRRDSARSPARFVAARARRPRACRDFPARVPPTSTTAYACQDAAIALWPDASPAGRSAGSRRRLATRFGEERLVGPIFARDRAARRAATASRRSRCSTAASPRSRRSSCSGSARDAPAGKTDWTRREAAALVAALHIGVETRRQPAARRSTARPGRRGRRTSATTPG